MDELNLLEVVEERNEDDVVNVPEYMEIINSPSCELKREKIAIERLLGSGNFCKVYKATLDNDTVAVKSLKGKTLYITSSSLYKYNNNSYGNFICVFECTIVKLATYRQFKNAS